MVCCVKVKSTTDIWALAGICAGLRYGWPAVLVLLKPTFVPFAIIGINRRRWWIAAAFLGLVPLPVLPLWFDYVTAARNMTINPDYSLGSLPLLLVGVTAWLGSRNPEAGRPSVPLLGRTTPRRLPPQ